MGLLRTSYMYGGFPNTILKYNLVRFRVCIIKLRRARMLILRCILSPKKLNYLKKKINNNNNIYLKSNIQKVQ